MSYFLKCGTKLLFQQSNEQKEKETFLSYIMLQKIT